MAIQVKVTENRTKVFLNGKYIKMIPSRYKDAFKEKFLLNKEVKRLTKKERFYLEYQLLLQKLKIEEPLLYEIKKNKLPVTSIQVTTVHGEKYFETLSRYGLAIKTNKRIFDLSPIQHTIHRNY